MDKNTKVISVYPCCGKTYTKENAHKLFYDADYIPKIADSDSSKFSWIEKEDGTKVRNPEFPKNYIEHIKNNIGKVDYIFVSSHQEVREALANNGIKFTMVVPEKNLLTDWMIRMYDRNNDNDFIDNQINNWDKWLTEIDEEKNTYSKIIKLKKYEFLSDVLYRC